MLSNTEIQNFNNTNETQNLNFDPEQIGRTAGIALANDELLTHWMPPRAKSARLA